MIGLAVTCGVVLAVAVSAALPLPAGGAAPTPGQLVDPAIASGQAATDLAAAKKRWKQRGPRSYSYHAAVRCFCGTSDRPATVTVRGGTVVRAPAHLRSIASVPRLFAHVERAIAAGAEKLRVRYHAQLGYVTLLDVNPVRNITDEEYRYTVAGFKVLTP